MNGSSDLHLCTLFGVLRTQNIQAKSLCQLFELSAYLKTAMVVTALWMTSNDAELQPEATLLLLQLTIHVASSVLT